MLFRSVLTAATVMEYRRNGPQPGTTGTYPYILFDSSIAVTDNSAEAEISPQILFPFGLVSDERLLTYREYSCAIAPETEYRTDHPLADFVSFYRDMIAYHPEYLSDDDLTIEEDTLILGKRFIRPEDDIAAIRCTITDSPDGDGYRLRLSVVE